jgi:hypothetical protein
LTTNDNQAAAPHANKRGELMLLINSRHPILTIETSEEERVEQLLFEVATQLNVPLFTWSVTTGLARFHGAPIYNSDSPEAALSNMSVVEATPFLLQGLPVIATTTRSAAACVNSRKNSAPRAAPSSSLKALSSCRQSFPAMPLRSNWDFRRTKSCSLM